jgi:hypothetical protein
MVTRKKTDVVQLSKIRMKETLRARLARDAERNGTTLNGEIVDRLEKSYANEAQGMRDSAIIDMLVDHNDVGSGLLRRFASELARHPDSLRSEAELKNMIGKIYVPGKRYTYEPRENPTTPKKSDK